MTATELAHKVQWEGGVLSALEYGVRSDEIDDPEIASLWRRMEDLYGQLRPSIDLADRLLKAARRKGRPTNGMNRAA